MIERRVLFIAIAAVLVVSGAVIAEASSFTGSQVERGAELYAFYCRTCHAANGEGLTPAWRATWDPEHQNCWVPKCHGDRYPRDLGFKIPRFVPAVMGPGTLQGFGNALVLNTYISFLMPYQDPDLLTPDEEWAITAFLAQEHGAVLDGVVIDERNASSILLDQAPPERATPAASRMAGPWGSTPWASGTERRSE